MQTRVQSHLNLSDAHTLLAGFCPPGGCEQCSNSKLLVPGQDWNRFATGNKCKGDHDLDSAWLGVNCYFDKTQKLAPKWWQASWGDCVAPSK
jgi:hypothetical protein